MREQNSHYIVQTDVWYIAVCFNLLLKVSLSALKGISKYSVFIFLLPPKYPFFHQKPLFPEKLIKKVTLAQYSSKVFDDDDDDNNRNPSFPS